MIPSRRSFLARAAGAGVAWLVLDRETVDEALAHAAHAVRQQPAPAFRVLAADEAADLSAVASRIVPTTDTPGATEAGVIYFIDRAIGAEQKRARALLARGVADLRVRAAKRTTGATRSAALAPADQDAILLDIEKGDFFHAMRFLTMVGMFGDPSWGGNRGGIGWKLLGFEHRPSYKAPYGYYDAEAAKGR